jgi:hypothetical protein
MSLLYSVLLYLAALPVAVWLLAAALSIVDTRHEVPALLHAALRFALGVVVILALAVLVQPVLVLIVGAALITVTVLHIGWFYALRKLLIGVPSYSLSPAYPPLLQADQAEEPADPENEPA